MLNAEKYRNEILAMIEKGERLALRANNPTVVESCNNSIMCDNCLFNDGICHFSRMKWLLSEYKEPIKLSRLEYEILKYILNHTEYKYITRDRLGAIFIYENKPEKHVDTWRVLINGGRYTNLTILDGLFKFIKWLDLEPTSIQEVLNNCEVVEDVKEL